MKKVCITIDSVLYRVYSNAKSLRARIVASILLGPGICLSLHSFERNLKFIAVEILEKLILLGVDF